MAALDLEGIAGHVNDAISFHIPKFMGSHTPDFPPLGGPGGFQITKYMVIEVAVAIIMFAIFVPYARKIRDGQPVKGRFWNMIEVVLLYMRDQVFRPAIGKKDADAFTPFLWTLFFFVLLCNLGGMLPWCGSPTGSLAVTAMLALSTFTVVAFAGMHKYGTVGFWTGLVPHMDVPAAVGIFLKPMLQVIEIAALLIKHCVLAIRLMANMFAGHMVLAVFLAFIPMAAGSGWWFPVTIGSVGMGFCLSLLELFVAFLQAYIFTFLSALYIGMAIHQH